jgi:hypothetical protein
MHGRSHPFSMTSRSAPSARPAPIGWAKRSLRATARRAPRSFASTAPAGTRSPVRQALRHEQQDLHLARGDAAEAQRLQHHRVSPPRGPPVGARRGHPACGPAPSHQPRPRPPVRDPTPLAAARPTPAQSGPPRRMTGSRPPRSPSPWRRLAACMSGGARHPGAPARSVARPPPGPSAVHRQVPGAAGDRQRSTVDPDSRRCRSEREPARVNLHGQRP